MFPDRTDVKFKTFQWRNNVLGTNQSDVKSVFKVVVPDFERFLCGLKLEDHSVEGQLLRAFLRNELHSSSKLDMQMTRRK